MVKQSLKSLFFFVQIFRFLIFFVVIIIGQVRSVTIIFNLDF
eukprot:UN11973